MSSFVARGRLRLVVGLAASTVLLGATVAQVDLGATVRVMAGASLTIIALAVVVFGLDLSVRALRWQILLRGAGASGATPLRLALGYLSVGYLANQVLPARTGDLLRAHLAGRAFALPRLATLGTIVVERMCDAGTILVLAVLSSMTIAGVAGIHESTTFALAMAGAGLVTLFVAWRVLAHPRVGASRVGGMALSFAERLGAGMRGVRSVRGALVVGATTLTAAGTAVGAGWLAAGAAGVSLTPVQAVLFVTGITLALAIPAAPGAIGTYEFIGVTLLTAYGVRPDEALASVILLRVVTTVPAVALGLASAWLLHLRSSVAVPLSAPGSSLARLESA